VSTRTPVKFGTTLEGLVKDRLRHYEPAFLEVSNQFLLYGYRKNISSTYQAYLLFQASRNAGLLRAEVAVCRDGQYPIARLSDFPDFGLGGYRESVYRLTQGFDHSDQYHSTESLFSLLLGLFRDMEQAVNRLAEKAIPRIKDNYEIWEPLYLDWTKQDHGSTEAYGHRFPGLWCEAMAFELLDKTLREGRFDRFLGPLKYRYGKPHVMSCHVYLLARAMEFLDPPDDRLAPPPPPPISEKIVSRYREPLDDPSPSLLGRVAQENSVELSSGVSERTAEYAFLKSLTALNSLFKLDESGRPCGGTLEVDVGLSSTQSLIDSPVYEQELESTPTYASPPPPPISAAPPRPEPPPTGGDIGRFLSKRRPLPELDDEDPIAALEARLGLQ
jgi:hypothetical protein